MLNNRFGEVHIYDQDPTRNTVIVGVRYYINGKLSSPPDYADCQQPAYIDWDVKGNKIKEMYYVDGILTRKPLRIINQDGQEELIQLPATINFEVSKN